MTQEMTSQKTLAGAGRRFTITGELKPSDGDSREWNGQMEYKVQIKKPNLRGPESFWAPENVAYSLKGMAGKTITLDLVSDRVRDDRPEDDKYWNYWCKVVGLHKPSAQTAEERDAANGEMTMAANPQPTAQPQDNGFNPLKFPDVEGIVQGHLEKLAMDLFVASHTTAELKKMPQGTAIHRVRLTRDALFHDLKSHLIAPAHYCFEHEKSRGYNKNRGTWFHPNTDGSFCIEGGAPAPQPDLSPEGFLASMEQPDPPPSLDDAVDGLFDEGGPDDGF